MQRGTNGAPASEAQFFSEQNETNLFSILQQDIQDRQGAGLDSKQQNRLARTLEHYMREVWDTNGPMPMTFLNREALASTTKDFGSYLRRGGLGMTLASSERVVSDPANQPRMEAVQQRLAIQQGAAVPPRPTFESNLLMDTGTRFEQMQQDRNPIVNGRPAPPNFQVSLTTSTDEPSALSLYERAKQMRDTEVARQQQQAQQQQKAQQQALAILPTTVIGSMPTDVNPLVRFMNPPSVQNDAQANPTIAQPIATLAPQPRGSLPQDFLIKQDDIINYKEIEHNLIVYSADRDWLNNSRENRYNFTVNFDPGNTKQGFYPSPTATKKFKNISRIELVKAILPSEGLTTLVQYSGSSFNTNPKLNVLSFPYINVHIDELDSNNYGTDNHLDNAFGVLQYDANWYTDTTNITDGYFGMIPKFMKCQKVYQPTPLATLQKLSIELQRPDGTSLSDTADTVSIQSIYFGDSVPAGTVYAGNYATANYIVIQTSTFFNQWGFTEGNTIQIKGLDATQINTYATVSAQANDFVAWLTQDLGHVLVGIGNTTAKLDGGNAVGYGNLLILRNRFQDPTTGSVALMPFGGAANNTALGTALYNSGTTVATTFTGAKLINLTHQVNLVFRIITREMDAAARVRPDNL